MQSLTAEESLLVERGLAAEYILKDPTFDAAFNELIRDYMDALIGTYPDQERERNQHYYSIKALQDLLGKLNQWVTLKEAIARNQEDSNLEDE